MGCCLGKGFGNGERLCGVENKDTRLFWRLGVREAVRNHVALLLYSWHILLTPVSAAHSPDGNVFLLFRKKNMPLSSVWLGKP